MSAADVADVRRRLAADDARHRLTAADALQRLRPAQSPAGNAQNAHILESAQIAERCARDLTRMGFTVLGLEIGSAKPVIWVQDSQRCLRLPGAWFRRSSSSAGTTYTWQAEVGGCHVQWHSPEGNPHARL